MKMSSVRFYDGGLLMSGRMAVSAQAQSNAVFAIEFSISDKLSY